MVTSDLPISVPKKRQRPEALRPPRPLSAKARAALVGLGTCGAVLGGCFLLEGLSVSAVVAAIGSGVAGALVEWLRSAQARIDAAQQQTRNLLGKGAHDSLWTWVPARGEVWFSTRWEALIGVDPRGAVDLHPWLSRIHPSDQDKFGKGLQELIAADRDAFRMVHRVDHDGSWRWVDSHAVATETDGERVLTGSVHDITEHHQNEARLAFSAFHDTLTGLPNRALFLDRLGHCVARGRRNPRYHFGVIFLDIDGFKVINDSLGHTPGDALLKMVAERLETSIRPGDTVARLGGDEFTVLLDPVVDVAQALLVARRLLDGLQGTFDLCGHRVSTSVSMGVAVSDGHYLDPQELLRDADTAMYCAKRDGKGQLRLFDVEMRATSMRRLQIESELTAAIDNDGLQVHYQPIVDLETNRIEGFEALVRLSSPHLGMIPPSDFIPVAEESGCIDAILGVVLEDAARQVLIWREHDPALYVTVNVSGRSLQRELVDLVRGTLDRYALPAEAIKFELTESVLVDAASSSSSVLDALGRLGVGLYIDDFGTGYSSLSYMHNFPIERLKIDRTFVAALDGDVVPGIVETIIGLSRRLNASVVAEGIETDAQLAALRALDCRHGQGWRFAPAVNAELALRFVQNPPSWGLKGEATNDAA
jgi:diguanylate cyclase (GGDEF)-like protein/PAS domain S-box-containing protein